MNVPEKGSPGGRYPATRGRHQGAKHHADQSISNERESVSDQSYDTGGVYSVCAMAVVVSPYFIDPRTTSMAGRSTSGFTDQTDMVCTREGGREIRRCREREDGATEYYTPRLGLG